MLLVLSACRGTQPYTQQDLHQIIQAYAQLHPVYRSFKQAYKAGDLARMRVDMAREKSACSIVDAIDARDTIDPTVNLFQASYGLDSICNSMEMAYYTWSKRHHLPVDKRILPSRPSEVFLGGDSAEKHMKKYLRRPAAIA